MASYIYALPSARLWGLFGTEVLSGWQINGLTILGGGSPFTITSGTDENLDGTTNDRPNQVGNPVISGAQSRVQKISGFFNKAAFAAVPAGTAYGNVSRASLLGPPQYDTDLALFKTFHLYKEHAILFRAEAFNAFNYVNLNNPNGVMTNAKFSTITGAGAPRIFQFALRYSF